MAGQKGAPTGRCQGCNHPERVRIERFLAAGAGVDRPISDCSRSTVLKVYRAAEMGDGNSVPATADQSLLPTAITI
jgi:hypothetical protein